MKRGSAKMAQPEQSEGEPSGCPAPGSSANKSGPRGGIDSRSRARGFAPRLRRAGRPAGLPHPRQNGRSGRTCTGTIPRSKRG